MGFTQTDTAINKQGIVLGARVFGDCLGCGMSKIITTTHHKCTKGIPWV
jgi:hypothetical protein